MKLFHCQNCGNVVHFDNTACVHCGHALGYLPERQEMTALVPEEEYVKALADPDGAYQRCDNSRHDACNWLVPADGGATLCEACRHNRTVPDLSSAETLDNWRRMERAKRTLFYSLMRWRLPIPTKAEDPAAGLAFNFLADTTGPDGVVQQVMTGHDSGLITINVAEADDAERERRRTSMGEPYRTLIGHFRHEVGHYYWDRLVRDRGNLDRFRAVFGDERADYGEALQRHYREGPPAGWQSSFISAYATTHPWEDFAETWAHMIHIVDSLETARAVGMRVQPDADIRETRRTEPPVDPYFAESAAELVDSWVPLTIAINSVNRSMGQPDIYPFVLSPAVIGKLQYMHELIHAGGAA